VLTVAFLVDVAVPVTLVLVMTTMGVNLVLSQLFGTLRQVYRCLGLTLLQFALLVPCAMAVGAILDLDPVLAMMLIAIAAAPGGALSTVYTFLARGNLELSVMLTTMSTVAATLLSPALVLLAAGVLNLDTGGGAMNFASVSRDLALFMLLPLLAGVSISWFAPALADRLRQVSSAIASTAILCLIAMSVIVCAPFLSQALPAMVVTGGVLTAVSFGIGKLVSHLCAPRDRSAVMLEFGVRNLPVALILIGGAAPDVRTVAYLLVYFVVSTTLLLAVSLFLRKAKLQAVES